MARQIHFEVFFYFDFKNHTLRGIFQGHIWPLSSHEDLLNQYSGFEVAQLTYGYFNSTFLIEKYC